MEQLYERRIKIRLEVLPKAGISGEKQATQNQWRLIETSEGKRSSRVSDGITAYLMSQDSSTGTLSG
jgi:hypothetical protein